MRLQNWLLKQADRPAALWAIFVLVIFESTFLFVPPEVFLTPTIVANRSKAKYVALIASIASIIGGACAYFIGALLFDSLGTMLITTFSSMAKFESAKSLYLDHGFWIIVLAAFSPLPYKLLAIAAGFFGMNPWLFIGVSGVFRSIRFSASCYLLWQFQSVANKMVQKFFWPLVAITMGIMIVGVLLL